MLGSVKNQPLYLNSSRSTSIIHPFLDFWLLGGASVAIWLIMEATGLLRGGGSPLDQRYLQIGAAFTLLTLVCNHPHFIISYQFGYGRGVGFIRRHWFALVAVPVLLVALFTFAYLSSETPAASGMFVDLTNGLFEFTGIGFRFGRQENLGAELMNSGIWLMYLTVGWHYSKQVFGCMMVYANFNQYPISNVQRILLKGSVFSVALLQFSYLYQARIGFGFLPPVEPGSHPQLTPLDLPVGLYTASIVLTVLFLTATLIFVFGQIYRKTGRLPSANFLIPWVAFYVWWVPFFQVPEFTFLMVPFFHSLQYLPFAYRVGTPNFKRNSWYYVKITAHAAIILSLGFIAFEGLPGYLDQNFLPTHLNQSMFFITAFAVFINVHHFFIDSVAWRFKDQSLRNALFEVRDRRAFNLADATTRKSPEAPAPHRDPEEARAL
jgi:hypothetical protein